MAAIYYTWLMDPRRNQRLKLCTEYKDTSTLTHTLANNAFRSLKFQDSTSMHNHIKQLCALAKACATASGPISDIDFGMVIVMSLPNSWSAIISTILSNSNSFKVANHLITKDNYNSILPIDIQVTKSSLTFCAIECHTIVKTMILKDRHTVFMFHDTLYTPKLSANLLSVSQLDDTGVNLKFGN